MEHQRLTILVGDIKLAYSISYITGLRSYFNHDGGHLFLVGPDFLGTVYKVFFLLGQREGLEFGGAEFISSPLELVITFETDKGHL